MPSVRIALIELKEFFEHMQMNSHGQNQAGRGLGRLNAIELELLRLWELEHTKENKCPEN